MNALRINALIFSFAGMATIWMFSSKLIQRDMMVYYAIGFYIFGAICHYLPGVLMRHRENMIESRKKAIAASAR